MTKYDNTYDAIIIGAGAAGLGAAYFLSASRSVLVLEREEQPAYHSSGRSAAMYIEGYENSVVAELTMRGGDFFKHPPEEFCQNPILQARGGLTIATNGEEEHLAAYLKRWQPLCPELTQLDKDQVLEIVPSIRDDWLSCGAYDPSWLTIDVHELLSTYQRGLKKHGAPVQCRCEVVRLQRDKTWQVETNQGEFRADMVINAAGAWACEMGQLANASNIPLTPLRRTAAIIPPPDASDAWPLVHTIDEKLYFKPESPGLMVCPQDETPSEPMDAYPDDMDVAIALARLEEVTHITTSRVMHQWAGLRTFTADRRPAIGLDPQAENFYWLAGQGGFGVQTSPGVGQMVAEHLVNDVALPDAIQAARFA